MRRLVRFDAAKRGKRSCTKPTSNSHEREKIAFGTEERLHRAITDIAAANCVARQFWDALNDALSFMLILVPRIERGEIEDEKSSFLSNYSTNSSSIGIPMYLFSKPSPRNRLIAVRPISP